MMKKNDLKIIFSFAIILVFSLALISALTGSIGNARMVLRINQGESVAKSILVQNVNDEPIRVSFFVSGDLNNSVKIATKNNLTLNAGEEKNIEFTIKASKPETTETKINFMFSPVNRTGAGVGLSSTIIVISNDGSVSNETSSDNLDESNVNESSQVDNQSSNLKPILGKSININFPEISALGWMVISTTTLFIILIVLFIVSLKYKKRRGENKIKKPHNEK